MRVLLLTIFLCGAALSQVHYSFDSRTLAAGLGDIEDIAVLDLSGDGRPDVLAVADRQVVWFENPSWKMRVAVDSDASFLDRTVRAAPFGRVNRIRHLAVIEGAASVGVIYRQPTEAPDPQQGTLPAPVVEVDEPWSEVARVGGGVAAMAWADLDADGSDELAVAGIALRLLDRDTRGEWSERRIAGGLYAAVVAADLDGDGAAEIVTADNEGGLQLHRNTSTLGWRRHVVAAGYKSYTVIGGDFTGDGKTDVISTDSGARSTWLYVAPDWQPVLLQTRTGAIHSATIDVDGDGDLDYIGARYNPGYIFWLENPADPLQDAWAFHVIDDGEQGGVNGVHGLLAGDVDGDGRLDLIGNSGQPTGTFPNSIAWYKIPADPTQPWPRHLFANGDAPGLSHYHGFGDLNGDGRGDIASAAKAGEDGNWFAWWEQPASASGAWRKHLLSTNEPGATNIWIADLNGDGKNDLIGTRGHGRGVVWFENPSFEARQIDTRIVGPHSLAVGDIDGDGDLDAATCAKDSRTAAWYENDGAGNFTVHHIYEDQASYDVRLVDMDGDGDLDLLNAGQESANVVWFENRLSH